MKNPLKNKPKTKNISVIPEKPDWMKVNLKFPSPTDNVTTVRKDLSQKKIHTVCESASCPNLNHCWSRKTATYMLGGDICTRRCAYCDIATGRPHALDLGEPVRVAESAENLDLEYVVLTAVNRDDLEDGGATQFSRTIFEIKKRLPNCKIEVLIPDFKGKKSSLEILYKSKPHIINHNIETVKEFFPLIVPQKRYETSLNVLKNIPEKHFISKSGIILGMGETIEQVKNCLNDLRESDVKMLTIGQYLQPTKNHWPLDKYIKPSVFKELKEYALSIGFLYVMSGPLVRSSYYADKQVFDLLAKYEKNDF